MTNEEIKLLEQLLTTLEDSTRAFLEIARTCSKASEQLVANLRGAKQLLPPKEQ